jgi:hypothetical protein
VARSLLGVRYRLSGGAATVLPGELHLELTSSQGARRIRQYDDGETDTAGRSAGAHNSLHYGGVH